MTMGIPRLKPDLGPEPAMPSACQARGCGGGSFAPQTPPLPAFSEVRVNGVEIEPEAIAQEIQHHPAEVGEAAWSEAARALAIRELLLQEARRLCTVAAPEPDEAGCVATDEDAVISALLDEEVEPGLPDEAECRRYYDARRERFRTPDLFAVSHVLIEPEGADDAAWRAAGVQARAIISEVGDDPAAFAEAARELSAYPPASQDGSPGQVRRGELVPQVQEVIEALDEGETHRVPVRSRFGWHEIRLHRRIEGHTLPFEAVQEKIAEMLAARSWSVAATRYVAALAEGRDRGHRCRTGARTGGTLTPMLGEVLALARRSSGDFVRWLEATDRDLADRIAAAADAAGESLTGNVRVAVAEVERYASEDEWTTLTSRLRHTDDPGTICLLTMVKCRLATEAAVETEDDHHERKA